MAELPKDVLELLELMKQHKIESKADFDNFLDLKTHEYIFVFIGVCMYSDSLQILINNIFCPEFAILA